MGDRCNPKEAWKTINNLIGRQNKSTPVNELKLDESSLTNPKDIYTDIYTYTDTNLATKIGTSNCNFETHLKKPESELTAFQPVTVNLVHQLLSGLSGKKATGVDKISGNINKIASPSISDSLTHIFNQSITLSLFLNEWKS